MLSPNLPQVINEHALPSKPGTFKLNLAYEFLVLNVVELTPNSNPVLLVQESDTPQKAEVEFELVESGQVFTEKRGGSSKDYLGSVHNTGRTIIHLVGPRQARSALTAAVGSVM